MSETNNPEGEETTPSGVEGQTSKRKQILTPEVEALVVKANATLTNYGRLEAELKRSQSVAEASIKRLRDIEESQLRSEEEAVKDDPERLSALRLRREASRRLAEAEEKERAVQLKETDIQSQRQEILQHHADRLSERYNVDTTVLLKYGGSSRDSLEDLAKSFGERTELKGESETETKRMKVAPPSGKTKGTSDNRLTRKSLSEFDIQGKTTQQVMADAKEILNQFAK